MENTFKNFSGKAINGKKKFEQISCTIWELDEFSDIIKSHFGKENNVFQMIEKIVTALQSVKEKIKITKRKNNDAVIKFKEDESNIVTFWFNNNSIRIRVVGDKTFDKEKTINNISQLEEFNVVDIISTKAKLM